MSRSLLIFTVALALLGLTTGLVALQLGSPSFLVLILTALAGATWLVYFFNQRSNRENFVKNYFLTIVLKLLAGGIFIFILLYADQGGANANAVLFLTAYVLFTGLEVGFLFRKLG